MINERESRHLLKRGNMEFSTSKGGNSASHNEGDFVTRENNSKDYSSRSRNYSSSRSRSYSKGHNTKSGKGRHSHDMSRTPSSGAERHAEEEKMIEINKFSTQKGPALDYMIFLSKNIENTLTSNGVLKRIEDQFSEVKLQFDYSFTIPDLNGCVLKIKAEEIKKKRDATQQLLEFIVKNNLDEPEDDDKKQSDRISILIMIPNGLVSMIIGTKGRQISNLIKASNANIVVNQPIYKMHHRTVAISGKPLNVANAIMSIQAIMEERYHEVSKVEMECKPLNVCTTQTNVKFIFNDEIVDHLTSKKASFMNYLNDTLSVSVKFYQDRKNRQLDRKDYIASMKGTIDNVQGAILVIAKKIQNYIRSPFDGKDSYTLKMLINKVFVTKLIGAGGCMIQEIANFSKGASIKIMSTKTDEKRSSSPDIPVCIAGSLASIQDASCIIIEQMECFKKGGPVLKSGKSLNQNIAHQFINSIFCSANRKQKEEEHCYTLKDRFASNKRKRSESKSHSQSRGGRSAHSHSRSHSRVRSRSKNKSRGNSRDEKRGRKSRQDANNVRMDTHYKNDNQEFDPSNNISYEEKGIIKISNDFIVPDYLVSLLIGKSGETIRGIMNKSGAMITFQKEYNDDSRINTADGVLGRICNLKGTPQQNSAAIQLISELIIKLETSLNGVRKEN